MRTFKFTMPGSGSEYTIRAPKKSKAKGKLARMLGKDRSRRIDLPYGQYNTSPWNPSYVDETHVGDKLKVEEVK